MELYAHQKRILDLNPTKYLIAHGTGTGKTITALSLAEKNCPNVLIIVPKALKENWKRAVAQFEVNALIVSKEEIRRDYDTLPGFYAIIIDEFHFFGNIKSQMSKALQTYIKKHQPKYVWGLTATPYCSSAMNIYSLASHLGHNWKYWTFFNRFFHNVQMGRRMVPVQRTGIEQDLASLVKKIGDTCSLEECVDVPEQTFETVYLELTPEQKKAIKAIDDTEAITRWTRQHTIENGIRIGDEYVQSTVYENLKTDYIISLAAENPKIAVICRYTNQLYMLKLRLESEGKKVFLISGEVKNRDEVVQQVEATDNCVVLIQAATAVGFEIPSVPIMVFASLSFSHVDHLQAQGRILRINKLKKNVYIYLVIKDGIDEDVYNCIMKKQDFQIAIYNK